MSITSFLLVALLFILKLANKAKELHIHITVDNPCTVWSDIIFHLNVFIFPRVVFHAGMVFLFAIVKVLAASKERKKNKLTDSKTLQDMFTFFFLHIKRMKSKY